MITSATLDFLAQLQENNHRPWFQEHKAQYIKAKQEIDAFVHKLQENLNKTDVIEFAKQYRIYRDVRFAKGRPPYKDSLGGYFRRFGRDRRGSYIFEIEPNATRVGGGFFGPNADDLLRLRKEFEMDGESLLQILNHPTFVQHFGSLQGTGVKTAPRGFDKQHPNIALIRKKQFYALRYFKNEEVIRKDFVDQVTESYLAIRPFFDYMTEILTTDLNGISILS